LILACKCHFLIQVKHNCPALFAKIALFTALTQAFSTSETYEKHRGREENRRTELYVNNEVLPEGWNGILRLVKVRRWGIRDGKSYHEVSFYILSKPINSAQIVAQGVRNHWGIENALHWTKDAIMGEDKMTISNTKSATMVAHLNTLAINVLRLAGFKPIKNTFAKFNNKIKKINILFQENYSIP